MLEADLPSDWRTVLAPVLATERTAKLARFLAERRAQGAIIYPPEPLRFAALRLTPLADVRVVILGQDPYHGPGQAHGLAFSVPPGVRPPPSLRNILRELAEDCGERPAVTGDLTCWARQGVLLLNTALSVEDGAAASHSGKGWEPITDAVVAAVAARPVPTVFILWGNHAAAKESLVNEAAPDGRHLVLKSAHPSPLSARRGFFGSRPFSRANAFLRAAEQKPVDWTCRPRGSAHACAKQ